jgi:hypothetical protein
MSCYGEAAIKAVELFRARQVKSPALAWEVAINGIPNLASSTRKKGCPKEAFLGLCEEGLVSGIPRGSYTDSQENKQYALDAITILKQHPERVPSAKGLWRQVTRGTAKDHNQQMDVVISLWKKGLL